MIVKDFDKIKEDSEELYGGIGEVWCPYLKEKEEIRVRVIVKRIKLAQPYFWSVIPFWKKREGEKKQINYGNPEEA
jgi:hypothetical protein